MLLLRIPAILEEIRFVDVHNAPSETDMRQHEVPPLLFVAALACFEDRSGCSCVLSEGLTVNSRVTIQLMGNDARNSFAVSSV